MFVEKENSILASMNKDRLKEIMFDQREAFNQPRHLIARDIDIDRYINSAQIVVITGIRRCGKSSLLYLIKKEMNLGEQGYCYFNFDDERISNDVSILEKIYNLHIEVFGQEPVLYFDEIQNLNGWEKFVNRMYEKGIKLFVTGSNAKLLSSDIATSLTGRNKVIELFPFSFSEYLRYFGKSYPLDKLTSKQKALIQKDFNQYFDTGGFPLVIKENDLELINGYYQDILYRDIISRYRLSQVHEIKEIGLYFASNIGKLFSYATLQKVSGIKSLSSIKDYLEYYHQSYLFFYLKKYDYSVKKQIMNPKKVYTIDPAFAHRLGFRFSENKGRILENIIFLEILRRGHDVYYYSGKNECDFLIKKGMDIIEAIQVSDTVTEENIEREINGLKEVMQLYDIDHGLLIVNDIDISLQNADPSITVLYAWNWLLS